MNEKSTAILSGTVNKIIVSQIPSTPDKAQIDVAGGDPLYREIRIVNALTDKEGDDVGLKPGQKVEITIEAHSKGTTTRE